MSLCNMKDLKLHIAPGGSYMRDPGDEVIYSAE